MHWNSISHASSEIEVGNNLIGLKVYRYPFGLYINADKSGSPILSDTEVWGKVVGILQDDMPDMVNTNITGFAWSQYANTATSVELYVSDKNIKISYKGFSPYIIYISGFIPFR